MDGEWNADALDALFRRMFNFYFLSCKAAFETDNLHLWHVVLIKKGQGRKVYPRVNLTT